MLIKYGTVVCYYCGVLLGVGTLIGCVVVVVVVAAVGLVEDPRASPQVRQRIVIQMDPAVVVVVVVVVVVNRLCCCCCCCCCCSWFSRRPPCIPTGSAAHSRTNGSSCWPRTSSP